MESVLQFSAEQYFTFFLVVLRVSGMFVTAPILSSASVPRQLRVYMALMVSMILFAAVPLGNIYGNWTVAGFLSIALAETMVGLMLGIVPRVIFAAVDFSGTIIGYQMGLSLANVMDPQTEVQVSIISSFKGLLATLLFVTIDGHHIFFEVLGTTYEQIPIGGFSFAANKIDYLLQLGALVITLGVKIGAPLIVSLLLANIILGFMARAMPQMNIFVVGVPLTILLGFLLLFTGMPYMMTGMQRAFDGMGKQVLELIGIMAH
ncbi:MAG: flagellar biosynthetic protein FliR [bacterium]|nr:flagellar biosynthetic protein FliR [bacterium]